MEPEEINEVRYQTCNKYNDQKFLNHYINDSNCIFDEVNKV